MLQTGTDVTRTIRQRDYERLLRFRTALRGFERWSADQAKRQGLTPAQHQLLLAVQGHGQPDGPTVGEVAEYLMVRHNSAVELVDRAQEAGLIVRVRDGNDHRVVRLSLTPDAARRLAELSKSHLDELRRMSGIADVISAPR